MAKVAQAEELSTFAARLAFAIRKRKTNANRIELATGMARQTVYLLLAGKTAKPSWPTLVKLCDHLGVRPEWLAEGDEPMAPNPILDDVEMRLIESYRAMSHSHQKDLRTIADQWANEDDADPRHRTFQTSHSRVPKQ
jgi:transcriptional regulator with XRE-family HTH domain